MLWITLSYPKHEKNGAPDLGLFGGSVGSSSVSRLRLVHQLAVTGSRLARTGKLATVWSTSLRRYSERKRKPAGSAQMFEVLSVCLVFLVMQHVTSVLGYLGFCSHLVISTGHLLLQSPFILVTLCFNCYCCDFWLKMTFRLNSATVFDWCLGQMLKTYLCGEKHRQATETIRWGLSLSEELWSHVAVTLTSLQIENTHDFISQIKGSQGMALPRRVINPPPAAAEKLTSAVMKCDEATTMLTRRSRGPRLNCVHYCSSWCCTV